MWQLATAWEGEKWKPTWFIQRISWASPLQWIFTGGIRIRSVCVAGQKKEQLGNNCLTSKGFQSSKTLGNRWEQGLRGGPRLAASIWRHK